jgi:hypothetical protein
LRIVLGGGRGIRTPGTVSGPTVFKTAAIDHSAIPPALEQEPILTAQKVSGRRHPQRVC